MIAEGETWTRKNDSLDQQVYSNELKEQSEDETGEQMSN